MFYPIAPRYQTVKHRPITNDGADATKAQARVSLTSMYARIDEDLREL